MAKPKFDYDYIGCRRSHGGIDSVFVLNIISGENGRVKGIINDFGGLSTFEGTLENKRFAFKQKYAEALNEHKDIDYLGNISRQDGGFEGVYGIENKSVGYFLLMPRPTDSSLQFIMDEVVCNLVAGFANARIAQLSNIR